MLDGTAELQEKIKSKYSLDIVVSALTKIGVVFNDKDNSADFTNAGIIGLKRLGMIDYLRKHTNYFIVGLADRYRRQQKTFNTSNVYP